MAKQLSVLYVTTEAYPFAKVSGLGDVAYSFPLAMRELGFDMRLMIPKYGCVSERKNRIHEINRLKDMQVKMTDYIELATIKSSSINNPRSKVQAYITTNDNYFNSKKGIYNAPETWEVYPDDAERFTFFCKTVIQTCNILNWYPDIIAMIGELHSFLDWREHYIQINSKRQKLYLPFTIFLSKEHSGILI